jgi:hypothetical protein
MEVLRRIVHGDLKIKKFPRKQQVMRRERSEMKNKYEKVMWS